MISTVRCYVPARRSMLADLAAGRPLPAGNTAFAVTPGLLDATGSPEAAADDEAAEYAATMLAADRSLRLLDAADPRDRRRVVVAVDAGASSLDAEAPGLVRLHEPVPLRGVASFHVDVADVEVLVDDAVRALAAGADAADEALAMLAGEELAWYAVQELDALL